MTSHTHDGLNTCFDKLLPTPEQKLQTATVFYFEIKIALQENNATLQEALCKSIWEKNPGMVLKRQ